MREPRAIGWGRGMGGRFQAVVRFRCPEKAMIDFVSYLLYGLPLI